MSKCVTTSNNQWTNRAGLLCTKPLGFCLWCLRSWTSFKWATRVRNIPESAERHPWKKNELRGVKNQRHVVPDSGGLERMFVHQTSSKADGQKFLCWRLGEATVSATFHNSSVTLGFGLMTKKNRKSRHFRSNKPAFIKSRQRHWGASPLQPRLHRCSFPSKWNRKLWTPCWPLHKAQQHVTPWCLLFLQNTQFRLCPVHTELYHRTALITTPLLKQQQVYSVNVVSDFIWIQLQLVWCVKMNSTISHRWGGRLWAAEVSL